MDIVACDEREPSAAELAEIEAEWPRIEADLAELDAEIARLLAGPGADVLVLRGWRRAQRRTLAALAGPMGSAAGWVA